MCVSKANRDEHNKSLVAQNFLVFETWSNPAGWEFEG